MRKPSRAGDDLSFMRQRKRRGTGFDYWVVTETGDYSAVWELGKALAAELLSYVGRHPTHHNAALLSLIVSDMNKGGTSLGGIEIAFLAEIMRYAMSTAAFVERAAA